ncbi:muconolactone delta-isomerase [Loktanella ponticola]|uniref:Muconolactone delta-isomerase n=1 Tax=Yoonia ponticola TaxID=1524255 RepID=A0A7W9BMC5_9RHOB|nr:gamma-glutamylcyclotransferase family protein [Yoonia ponticola]MBB5723177.1 muconolactone delta-isomerase [Yoonia ponticola]
MNDPQFFGYGSLVNLKTHGYVQPQRAQVTGWRRIWRSTTHSKVAILSVTPDANTTLDGIVAQVPNADWVALDARERAYTRQIQANGVAIYEITDEIIHPESGPHPILRSYLDVVIQGYLTEFGPVGAARFFETTDNWGPITDDRDAPRYPRHQQLSADETAFVDKHLAALR